MEGVALRTSLNRLRHLQRLAKSAAPILGIAGVDGRYNWY